MTPESPEPHGVEELLAELYRLESGVSPAPWRSPWLPGSKHKCAGVESVGSHYIVLHVDEQKDYHPDTIEMWKRDCEFITFMRNNAKRLAELARPLQSPVGELPPLDDNWQIHENNLAADTRSRDTSRVTGVTSLDSPDYWQNVRLLGWWLVQRERQLFALTAQLAAAQADISSYREGMSEMSILGARLSAALHEKEEAESKLTTQREDTIRECAEVCASRMTSLVRSNQIVGAGGKRSGHIEVCLVFGYLSHLAGVDLWRVTRRANPHNPNGQV